MIDIDGSMGEGGGQIIRSSLALSMVTGQAVTIDRVRAGDKKPGLRKQHLTSVQAAAQVCQAEVEGAELGSSRLVFRPGTPRGGDYRFQVGTAGSTSLVLQTVLPALILIDQPTTITIEGGTHNPLAPPFDFLDRCYFPLLARLGPTVRGTLGRHGFYPAGGGRVQITVQPVDHAWHPLDLTEPRKIQHRAASILLAQLPLHIAQREGSIIQRKLNWREEEVRIQQIAESSGPGNVVLLEVRSANITEIVTAFGERGRRAEQVANQAVRELQAYLKSGTVVGEHLADQLLLPLALCAQRGDGSSRFTTRLLSGHTKTHIDVVQRFLDVTVHTEPWESGGFLISVSQN